MDTLHKILDLMWKNGISDADLCSKAGINKSAVTDWKKGKTKSYYRHLPQIAAVLGVSADELDDRIQKEKPTADGSERSAKLMLLNDLLGKLSDEQLDKVLDYFQIDKDGK